MILFFTLINNPLNYEFFKNRNKVFYVYIFYLIFIFMRIVKNNYLAEVSINCLNDWLRGTDLNRRPSGYEPDELPDCSTPRYN